jgi:hypothetical protein
MFERDLINWMRFHKRLHCACIRKVVGGWFECDALGLTPAKFWHEFEIKHSKADYSRDFHKKLYGWSKHDVLRMRLEKTSLESVNVDCDYMRKQYQRLRPPNYFWFVVPEDIESSLTLPEHAGLLILRGPEKRVFVRKEAPRIHADKITDAFMTSLLKAFEYRFYDLIDWVSRLQREVAELRGEKPEAVDSVLDCKICPEQGFEFREEGGDDN